MARLISRAKDRAVRLKFRNEPGATSRLRRALDRVARASDLPADVAFDLKLAATEALSNAISGAPRDHAVDVAIRGGDGRVDVELVNRGHFRPAFADEGALEAEGGRGIPLMLALVDEVEFASVRGGTRVRLRQMAA